MKKYGAAILFSAVIGSACTGTDVGNPIIDVEFESYNLSAATATVDTAWLVAESVSLRPATDCSGGAEIEFVGPFVLDLMGGTPLLGLSELIVEPTQYCRMEVSWQTLAEAPPETAPSELMNAAMVIQGTTGTTRFTIITDRMDDLRIDATDARGFTIGATTFGLFVAFDMSVWVEDIDFTSAVVGGNGEITISVDENSDLLEDFDDKIEDAVNLFADIDGDGSLDADELSNPLASGFDDDN